MVVIAFKNDSLCFHLRQLMVQVTQDGLKKEIAAHRKNGQPIFYSWKGISIMELPDGRRFEYKLDESGTEKIIRELP